MKRLVSILIFILTLSLSASAQWYLFPEREKKAKQAEKQQTEKTKTETKDSTAPAVTPRELDAPVTVFENPEATPETAQPADSLDLFVLDIPETVNVTMLLPVHTAEKPSSNFLEMYAGGMLAARDLGKQGVKVNLSVYDCIDEDSAISESVLADSDVIIGPVSTEDITRILDRCPAGKRIVSPLEPKAAALADSCGIVQAPSSWADQIDELIAWVAEENMAGDAIVLVRDTVAAGAGEQAAYLVRKLQESGMKYTSTYLASSAAPSATGCTRYIIASERDAYVATALRQIGVATMKRKDAPTAVYLTSKMRNAKGVEPQYLYKSCARVTASYFTDYDNEAVKDFILSYRALFKDEPASFAYQGYDTVSYFTKACVQFGRQWYKKLPENPAFSGLQSSFRFEEMEGVGQANRAVRRIVYNPDMSTTVKQ